MMKTCIALGALLIGVGGMAAAQQSTAKVAVSPESKLWIEGTSNLQSR